MPPRAIQEPTRYLPSSNCPACRRERVVSIGSSVKAVPGACVANRVSSPTRWLTVTRSSRNVVIVAFRGGRGARCEVMRESGKRGRGEHRRARADRGGGRRAGRPAYRRGAAGQGISGRPDVGGRRGPAAVRPAAAVQAADGGPAR